MRHLLVSGNSYAGKGALCVALSYLSHNEEPVTIHFLTADLSDLKPQFVPLEKQAGDYIDSLLKTKNPESAFLIHDISDIVRKSPLMKKFRNSSYSPYALLRLFADLTPGLPDLVLYLDTDTVIMKELGPLFETPMEGHEFAGARDYLGRFWIGKNYQNSGVLLMNLKEIKETGLLGKCRDYLSEHKPILADQDALNYNVREKVFLEDKFNEQHEEKEDTVIRHFTKTIRFLPFFHTVNIKPWMTELVHSKLKTHAFDELLAQYEEHYPKLEAAVHG